jgi:hypothetical protein
LETRGVQPASNPMTRRLETPDRGTGKPREFQ